MTLSLMLRLLRLGLGLGLWLLLLLLGPVALKMNLSILGLRCLTSNMVLAWSLTSFITLPLLPWLALPLVANQYSNTAERATKGKEGRCLPPVICPLCRGGLMGRG